MKENAETRKAERRKTTGFHIPPRAAPKPWDDERIGMLRRLAGSGATAKEIATMLGTGLGHINAKAAELGIEIVGPAALDRDWTPEDVETVGLCWRSLGGPMLASMLKRPLERVTAKAAELGLPAEPVWVDEKQGRVAAPKYGRDGKAHDR